MQIKVSESYLASLTEKQREQASKMAEHFGATLKTNNPEMLLPLPIDVMAKMLFDGWGSEACSLEHSTRYYNPDYEPFSLTINQLRAIREHWLKTGVWDLLLGGTH